MKQKDNIPFYQLSIEQYFSRQKIKITGDIIQLSRFQKEFAVGQRQFKSLVKETDEEPEKLSPEEIRHKSLRRAKTRIIDAVNTNVFAWKDEAGRIFPPVFLTLTFKKNLTDIELANYEFTKFMQRLNWEAGHKTAYHKYVVVIEFQKRGAIHYHQILFNMPFIYKTKLQEIWGNGFIKVKEIDDVRDVGFYVTKYLVKDLRDPRLKGHKSYFISRGLLKPTIIHFEEVINLIKALLPQESLEQEKLNIPIKYLSAMDYWRYNLRQYPEARTEIQQLIQTFL
jgi:hypothetical protein